METKEEILETLKSIQKAIEDEHVSYGEIYYLQTHKQDVLEYGDIVLAQWADISEEEWNAEKLRPTNTELLEETEELIKQAVLEDYSHVISLSLLPSIKEDLKENADVVYSDYDLKLAVGRALMDKLNLWHVNEDELMQTLDT